MQPQPDPGGITIVELSPDARKVTYLKTYHFSLPLWIFSFVVDIYKTLHLLITTGLHQSVAEMHNLDTEEPVLLAPFENVSPFLRGNVINCTFLIQTTG